MERVNFQLQASVFRFLDMKILVIDNYDSFTYNLVHAIKKISGQPVDVYRNDEIKRCVNTCSLFAKSFLGPRLTVFGCR